MQKDSFKGSEFQFIERIRKQFSFAGSELGIGDDCAVIPFSDSESYLITSDALVEDVHFALNTTSFKDLGWKALAVNLSDLAAMGGIPKYFFISIAVPKTISHNDLTFFYDGIKDISNEFNVTLLGGDTTASKKHFFISITVVGMGRNDKILLRTGAKAGDKIYVTGTLGDSAAGLFLLRNQAVKQRNDNPMIQKHLRPIPRIHEMTFFNAHYKIHSAIDLSDGLSGDLGHILSESDLGAHLLWENLPLSADLLRWEDKHQVEGFVLHGGEDYEVLFTSPEDINTEDLLRKHKIMLGKIGEITDSKGLQLTKDGSQIPILPSSFDHFKDNM
ncbi:MAG: thiamine-monophosphate kinase [bacterium]|nr:MAG: thiamine-monophosphate kinase [bacterium]